jgi:two-component sensor histidine kinase
LGLKLVNILTRQLNGQLTVQSTGGARFSIVIQNMKVSV